ncbi:MAG: hypothetical protein ACLFS5_07715 [Spirochaetaceae bacterium]
MASGNGTQPDSSDDGTGRNGKIYCANCYHCKLSAERISDDGEYLLRVRCDAGQWKKKQGKDKLYKYSTVIRRSPEHCEYYEPMGSLKDFLRELKKTLPVKDEIYANE